MTRHQHDRAERRFGVGEVDINTGRDIHGTTTLGAKLVRELTGAMIARS
ncbi:MAG: hypothetical protein P8N50_09770 [Actinomycetota bacterium]|nr:hypothetical protein [Actinomycetota bacterium]